MPVSASSTSTSNPSGATTPASGTPQPTYNQSAQSPYQWTAPADTSGNNGPSAGPISDPSTAPTPNKAPATSSQPYGTGGNGGDQQASATLEQTLSSNFDSAIDEYQQNSEEFVDDVNEAIDTFDQISEFNEAIAAYRQGDLDNYVVQNLADAAYQGATGAAIDAAIPRNGDPLQNSFNDFSQALNRVFQTQPTLSGAIDRVKGLFQQMTGNFKGNLDCLKKAMLLNEDDCTNP